MTNQNQDKHQKKGLHLILLLPILLCIVACNYFVDLASIYHDVDETQIAKYLLEGKQATLGNSNGNEREVKRQLIMQMPDQVDCIVVGPSLVMEINREVTGEQELINLGVSGADMYDMLAQFGIMDIYGKKADRVIFAVDSYWFDETLAANFGRSQGFKPYAYYLIDNMYGGTMQPPVVDAKTPMSTYVTQLFSASYFKSNAWSFLIKCKGALQGEKFILRQPWGLVDDSFTGDYYDSDGSWVYSKKAAERTVENVRADAAGYNIEYQFSKGGHIGEKSCEIFEHLLTYLQERGTQVDLFLCPLSPSLYDRLDGAEDYYVLQELEAYAKDVAERYELRMIGSFDPYEVGIKDEDFFDARHVRGDRLAQYFDFTKQ
ncbi:MAG: hypothetical protein MJ114_03900 [Acetatifactor sp.]|nr:hypothetical protein [Acetatifactor sp.]